MLARWEEMKIARVDTIALDSVRVTATSVQQCEGVSLVISGAHHTHIGHWKVPIGNPGIKHSGRGQHRSIINTLSGHLSVYLTRPNINGDLMTRSVVTGHSHNVSVGLSWG